MYLPRPGNTWLTFKWAIAGLNSVFSFSKTSCCTKANEPSLPCYLPIAGFGWGEELDSCLSQEY